MSVYKASETVDNLNWGTRMPVMAMIASSIVQIRARGVFSVMINDPDKLAAEVPDAEELPFYLQSLAASAMTDLIGMQGHKLSSVEELTSTPQIFEQEFKNILVEKLQPLGLQLKDATIEAIENL